MRKLSADEGKGHVFPRKGNEDHKAHIRTMEKHQKLHNQDWQDVVVVNMHPFPLQVHFGDAGLLTIKKCEDGKPYFSQTIDMYRITKADKGNADYEPIEILPIEQALELERKYQNMGGVFSFAKGTNFPVEKLKAAGDKQIAYYRALVRKAKDEWAKFHSLVRVSDAMRQAAKYLAKHGGLDISKMEWVDAERGHVAVCEQCGEDRKTEAKVCRHCEFPFDIAWVLKHRKDLATKYGLTASDIETSVPAQQLTAEDFLSEDKSDDAALLGAV